MRAQPTAGLITSKPEDKNYESNTPASHAESGPLPGTAFGFGPLVFAIWRKSEELKKAALGVFIIVALLAVPVYLAGESAADVVKSLPGVSMAITERSKNEVANSKRDVRGYLADGS